MEDNEREERSCFSAGMWDSEIPSDWRSRAFPEPWERREVVRSMSRMPLSASRHFDSRNGSARNAAIKSWRAVRTVRSRRRMQNPVAQQARAHRCCGAVEHA